MKIECTYCHNQDSEKFAKTKKGAICLLCYERAAVEVPENESEKAVVAIRNHMQRPTGGNNRKWTNAYRAVQNKADFLESLPGKTPEQEIFAKAFREALRTFDETARG